MLLLSRLHCLLAICALSRFNALAISSKRDGCAGMLATATAVAERLQSNYYNTITGEYSELWTDANTLEDIHNLMLAAGTMTWDSLADESFIGRFANVDISAVWSIVLGGSYDDAQWVILALWKMADYKATHGEDYSSFTDSATAIYDIVAAQWDNICGGGGNSVWWSSAKTYKNAITNELFLYTSALGYIRTQTQSYLDNAEMTWAWLEQSGMRNSQGLWNDGLNMTSCQNNGDTTWTYNQGVIASGLAALSRTTSNTTLLDQAEITLDATINFLTQDNILKESCDDVVSDGSTCDADEQIFKGVWTKHLQYYLDNANDTSRTAKYSPFLGSQKTAIINHAINSSNDVSSAWYAANQGGGLFSAQSAASGLAALNAAAKDCHVGSTTQNINVAGGLQTDNNGDGSGSEKSPGEPATCLN
ncbi:glycoside hydrolase family 76 protein [Piloderma croceum F 1598]|uniref:Glycoside hydrolase family 76 protein n=1 Tax=Piloderma croceum (strain F 1598) TaxID=765440 RepID=A0A0C3FE54_PILCF|nr:glycoside hydrolase family 76 protein [Piloderma croceum F 1598]